MTMYRYEATAPTPALKGELVGRLSSLIESELDTGRDVLSRMRFGDRLHMTVGSGLDPVSIPARDWIEGISTSLARPVFFVVTDQWLANRGRIVDWFSDQWVALGMQGDIPSGIQYANRWSRGPYYRNTTGHHLPVMRLNPRNYRRANIQRHVAAMPLFHM